MDRTAWIVVILCLIGIAAHQFYAIERYSSSPSASEQTSEKNSSQIEREEGLEDSSSKSIESEIPRIESRVEKEVVFEEEVAKATATLENDFFQVVLTNQGAGIEKVILKKHHVIEGQPVVLNKGATVPLLNISGGLTNGKIWGYSLVEQSASSVLFEKQLSGGLKIRRHYELEGDYQIKLTQYLENTTESPQLFPPYQLRMGVSAPLHALAEERRFVGVNWYTAEQDYESRMSIEFDSTEVFTMTLWEGKAVIKSEPGQKIRWAGVQTQFFIMLTDFNEHLASSIEAVPKVFPDLRTKNEELIEGIKATANLDGVTINPGMQVNQTFSIYAGPKEDWRLRELKEGKDEAMEFGIMGFISRPLLWTMNFINQGVEKIGVPGSYGWAIILMTLLLKILLWIPQSNANRSMKRMQAVAPLMKKIQDKYKEKPEKLQKEMMGVYKDYGVNPVGGCLPMLLQLPIFLGFYWMLLGAIELRHAEFAWIGDLSQPDTVFTIAGLSFIPIFEGNINPMPLLMAITMWWSMSITPQPSGVDNPMIVVMKIMPVMFLLFCYNFASALSLYWTCQNLLSIVQMRYNLKQEAPTLEQLKEEVAAKKKAKKKK